jgi:glucokinase
VIDSAALEEKGWRIEIILNDFEAGVWALPGLKAENLTTLKPAPGASNGKCLLGPGTGLGLGYLHGSNATLFVQKTHGGHMPLAARTDEQWTAAQTIKAQVFEHIVSGPGLQKLRGVYDPDTALRLFHEFFGLFAATAVIGGNAYGGVYLTGGVLESLIADDLFNFPLFEEWLCVQGAASVTRDLHATPVYHVTDPYPALKGLLNA